MVKAKEGQVAPGENDSLSDPRYQLARAIRHQRYVMELFGLTKARLGEFRSIIVALIERNDDRGDAAAIQPTFEKACLAKARTPDDGNETSRGDPGQIIRKAFPLNEVGTIWATKSFSHGSRPNSRARAIVSSRSCA